MATTSGIVATVSNDNNIEYTFEGDVTTGIHQVLYGEGTSKGIDVLAGTYDARDEAQIVKAIINMRSDPLVHKYRDVL